jgi:hypothetical protein
VSCGGGCTGKPVIMPGTTEDDPVILGFPNGDTPRRIEGIRDIGKVSRDRKTWVTGTFVDQYLAKGWARLAT